MSYHDAYHRFVRKIGNHVGVGPYKPISEEQMQAWVDEFKAEIDAWHEDWKKIKLEHLGEHSTIPGGLQFARKREVKG